MSADRELLELAAKAYWAGEIDDVMSFYWDEQEAAIVYTHADNQDHNGNDWALLWNPLIDDGDALRLAVKLDMYVRCDSNSVCVIEGQSETMVHAEVHSGDPYAATRRAIVRAAAEIGKDNL